MHEGQSYSDSPDIVLAIFESPMLPLFVCATPILVPHSIRDFLDAAFNHVGITDWSSYVKQDPRFMRPAEVDVLRGDSTKAQTELGWKPKTSFEDLVQMMVDYDIELAKRESVLLKENLIKPTWENPSN